MNERLENSVKRRIKELYNEIQNISIGIPSPIVARACLKMLAYLLVWDNDGDEEQMYGEGCAFGSSLDEYQVEELNEYWKQLKSDQNAKEKNNH